MDWKAVASWSWDEHPQALHIFVVSSKDDITDVCRRHSWTCAFEPGVIMDVTVNQQSSRSIHVQVIFVTPDTVYQVQIPTEAKVIHVYMTNPLTATWSALSDILYSFRRPGHPPRQGFLYLHGNSSWAQRTIAEQIILDRVRDIQNQPANKATPESMAQHISLWFQGLPGVTVETLHHDDLKREGLMLIDAVGKGSVHPPTMVVVRYTPRSRSDIHYQKRQQQQQQQQQNNPNRPVVSVNHSQMKPNRVNVGYTYDPQHKKQNRPQAVRINSDPRQPQYLLNRPDFVVPRQKKEQRPQAVHINSDQRQPQYLLNRPDAVVPRHKKEQQMYAWPSDSKQGMTQYQKQPLINPQLMYPTGFEPQPPMFPIQPAPQGPMNPLLPLSFDLPLQKGGLNDPRTLVLIGKGITFDTGGYSMKSKQFIQGMHTDKSGASVVLGLIYAAATSNYRNSIVGLLPFAHNVVSDRATLPHDVVRSYAGLDVEITDTDAEGRLVLADALAYIPRVVPVSEVAWVVDVATLTGLGDRIHPSLAAGVFTYNKMVTSHMERIGEQIGEYVWRIPHWKEGESSLSSTLGDLVNVGSSPDWHDTFMAGVFLHRFVPASLKKKWIHVDVANNWSKRLARGKSWRLIWQWMKSL